MSKPEIWHNPRCSKSRQTLALLEERGVEPQVVLYLKEPPGAQRIQEVLAMLGIKASALVRSKESLFKDLGLKGASEGELIEAMAKHPKLIERPVVILDGKAALGRPPEKVLELLAP